MQTPRPEQPRANRLARESSPYLLQHAHNPVDWHPWGEEAFELARERDVPIFLSIGYSTCYWCHVMERESFEDAEVAALMNDAFVCVKVDREERPDVDDLYMTATQAMTGHGGWPMSVFLEPASLRPFWCGTYFPPHSRGGMPGFVDVLAALSKAWRDQRGEVLEQAEQLAQAVREHVAIDRTPRAIGPAQVRQACEALLRLLDRASGGFGGAPKFPQPANLEFLLTVREHAGDAGTREALDHAARLSLDRMLAGGVYDQVGGGFHRYSVDQRWIVPHFEKMLYDNAQLASLYARAAAVYDDAEYRRIVRETLDYVLREMTSADGAFWSAQDAEVDGREGLNYLWSADEVREALGDDAPLALRVLGLEGGPNFRDPHHPDAPPTNVLCMAGRRDRIAADLGMSSPDLGARLDAIRARLLAARSRRRQPRLDDKVLAAWNGLMIAAMARGGNVLGERRYIDAGERAAAVILSRLRAPDGSLLRSWRDGTARVPGYLEDHAAVAEGLLALHRAGARPASGPSYLEEAQRLVDIAIAHFGDGSGGVFDVRAGRGDLFARAASTSDGAVPSGASMLLGALIDLHELTGERSALDRARSLLRALSAAIARSPVATINATRGLMRLLAIDPAGVEAMGGEPAPEAGPAHASPVEVFAEVERIAPTPEEPESFTLRLRVLEGFHVTAADPGPGGAALVPLRVGVVGGSGVVAYAEYPPGERLGGEGSPLVYRGEVDLAVVVERTGGWSGRPMLVLTYQACTERECLAPARVELDIAIDRADAGADA